MGPALAKVISGGQTGVDQAALRAALDCGLAVGGWCPPGCRSEAGPIPPVFPLRETPRERSILAPEVPRSLRTEWNVRDADATLVLLGGPALTSEAADPGTVWTQRCAERLARPWTTVRLDKARAAETIWRWLWEGRFRCLNVAGPSERSRPGIGCLAYRALQEAFEALSAGPTPACP